MRRRIRVVDAAEDDWSDTTPALRIATARRVVNSPVRLLVENELTDGAFVRAWTPANRRALLVSALAERRLEFAHGGGNTHMAESLQEWGRTDRERLFGILVLADSDAKAPGMRPNQWPANARRLEGICRGRLPGLGRYHFLGRRTIESYMPLDALRHVCSKKRRLDFFHAFAAEGSDRRHHFNLKGGLVADLEDPTRRGRLKVAPTELTEDDLGTLPPHWRGLTLERALTLLAGLGDDVFAECLPLLAGTQAADTLPKHASIPFDTDSDREAEQTVEHFLRWL